MQLPAHVLGALDGWVLYTGPCCGVSCVQKARGALRWSVTWLVELQHQQPDVTLHTGQPGPVPDGRSWAQERRLRAGLGAVMSVAHACTSQLCTIEHTPGPLCAGGLPIATRGTGTSGVNLTAGFKLSSWVVPYSWVVTVVLAVVELSCGFSDSLDVREEAHGA